MSDALFKIPATMSSYKGMSHRSMRIAFDTQENLSDDEVARIAQFHEKFCWLVVLHEQSKDSEIIDIANGLPPLVVDQNEKTPAQRQRAVLYRLWEKNGKNGDPELFYRRAIEAYIDKIKEKLD